MNENDAFYNALLDVAAWDKENTLDRFMNSDSLFKKFLYKFITTDGSYVKLRSSLEWQHRSRTGFCGCCQRL